MGKKQHYYQQFARMQRQGEHGTAAKDAMRLLAGIALICSGCFWFPIEWQLVGPQTWGDVAMAIGGGLFLVVGPPVLTSFLVPWSAAGQLLSNLKWRTVGQVVVLAASLYLLYHSFTILQAWWAARPMVAQTGLTTQQAVVGIIANILVPALLWAPVSSEELQYELRQHQLVERYKVQTAADIAILQKTLLQAQQKAAVGFANLTAGEREELAAVMHGLIAGIDQTQQEIAGNLQDAMGVAMQFPALADDADFSRLLATAHDAFTGRMVPVNAQALPVSQPSIMHQEAQRTVPRTPADGSTEGSATVRHGPQRTVDASTDGLEDAWETAQEAFGVRAWTRKELQDVLGIEKSKASDIIRRWRSAGVLIELTEPAYRYQFVERG